MLVGAGMAGIGTARLLLRAMMKEGSCEKDALCKIIMYGKHGLITRSTEKLTKEQVSALN